MNRSLDELKVETIEKMPKVEIESVEDPKPFDVGGWLNGGRAAVKIVELEPDKKPRKPDQLPDSRRRA